VLPELRLLRSYVAVVEAGSLTRAAAELHMAQQSLSQQMTTLEAQLGVTLLTRSPRGVAPTEAGAVLSREAKAVLARAERAVDAVRRGAQDVLRVGFLSSVANYFMPPVVRAFGERHPGVAFEAEDMPIAALVAGLREGRLDAGLSRPPLVDDLVTEVVYREPVAAVLPEGHRLASRTELTLAELADEPWVLTPRASWPPWHAKYDADFAHAGFQPRVVQRGTTPQGLLALVAAGVGVTRLTLSSQSLRDGGVAFVPLAGEDALVVLMWRADAGSPMLPALRAVVRDVATALARSQPPAARA
jgi:DNA-binding transcriptional LysR family regulator